MNQYKIKQFCCVLTLLLLTGCVTDKTGTSYSQEEARQVQQVQFGTIYQIQLVKIEGSQSGVGAVAGGASGAVAASAIGGGRGSTLSAIVGGVAGGLLGNLAEKKITKKQGVELTIKLDNGTLVSTVQQVDPKSPFSVGERVKILGQGKTRRVVKVAPTPVS